MKLPNKHSFSSNQKGFTHFILVIILGIFPLLLFAFAFATHAESTSETPRQLCDDARKESVFTILEDTQDKCTYVSPGVIKIEHFYQGNQLCLRTTGFKEALTFGLDADGEITTECFDRESSNQVEKAAEPTPAQGATKQSPPEPTAASEKSGDQEEPAVKVSVFGTDVKVGDTVVAEGKSKTVVFLPDGGKVDLKEGAKIKFHSNNEIEMISGVFKFLIKHLTGGEIKKFRTGDMVIGVRGTEFLVEVGDNGNTTVKVIDGTVEVSNPQGKGTVQVAAGQETKTARGGIPAKPKVFDPKTLDNWWEGLPMEAPSDDSDFWVGLISLGLLCLVFYLIIKKIRNVLRGNETSKRIEPPGKKKRGIFSKIFIVIVIALVIFVIMVVVFSLVS